jgi:hypothetical protein
MQGSLHQALALTASGNAFLQGWEIGPFWPENDAFVFCREVRFVEEGPKAPSTIAADPALWLERLAARGAGLNLRIVPRNDPRISDMMSIALANHGPRLLIEAMVPGRASTYWEPYWEVIDPDDRSPDRKPWLVTYSCAPNRSFAEWPAERPLGKIESDIAELLERLTDFAERAAPEEAMPGWVENFRNARAALDRTAEWQGSNPAPPGFLSPEALRLLHVARAGWVFGGMGAWNDGAYWGSAKAEGDRLSEALFALLNEAVASVANSGFRAG